MNSLTSWFTGIDPRYRYPKKKKRSRVPSSRNEASSPATAPAFPTVSQGDTAIAPAEVPKVSLALIPPDWEALTKTLKLDSLPFQSMKIEPEVKFDNEDIEQILSEYDLKARYVQSQDDWWNVETDFGSVIIKQILGLKPMHRAQNIVSAIKYLRKNGFTRCPEPLASKYGESVISIQDRAYYIYPKINGRPARLDRLRDYRDAGHLLVLLHQTGEGYHSVHPSESMVNLLEHFKHGKKSVESWLQSANSQRFFSDADRLLKDTLPRLMERAERAFDWMAGAYEKQYGEAKQRGTICHGQYREKCLMKNSQGLWVDDFEKHRLDTPIVDLAEFVANVAMSSRDGWKSAIAIIEGYEWVHRLTPDDWKIILGYLLFPHSLWQYVHDQLQPPEKKIEIIPDRKLQDQGYKRAQKNVETCKRMFLAANRLSAHAEIDLPS